MKMKRILLLLITGVLLFTMIPVNSMASENSPIIYFEDGSYIVETFVESNARSSYEKSGSKVRTFYDRDGNAAWKAVLNGTFTYNGTSATCTNASVSVNIYDSNWYMISKSASKSGNTATGTVEMGYKTLGVTTRNVTTDLTLTCDKDGNLS